MYTSINKIVICNLLADKKYYESIKASYSFAAAGDILAEVWSESVIDSYPVVAEYLSPPENIHEAMIFMEERSGKQNTLCNPDTCYRL